MTRIPNSRVLVLACLAFALSACAPAAGTSPTTPTVAATSLPAATASPPTPTVTATAETLEPVRVVTSEGEMASADTVLDADTAQYARRVLAAYENGQIPSFGASVISPKVVRVSDDDAKFLQQGYGPYLRGQGFVNVTINGVTGQMLADPNDIFRGATIVQDGQGGARIVQAWLQSDGTLGLVWYHLSAALKKSRPSQFGYRIRAPFDGTDIIVVLPMKIKDLATCRSINFVAKDDCQAYMDPQQVAGRDAAIDAWASSGVIPPEIRDGQIEFMALTTY